jgi:hypothetical protein
VLIDGMGWVACLALGCCAAQESKAKHALRAAGNLIGTILPERIKVQRGAV